MRLALVGLVVILVGLAGVPASRAAEEPQPVPFRMTSIGGPFGLQADLEGVYRVYPDVVVVTVKRGRVLASDHCPYKGRRLVRSIELGLAVDPGDCTFKFVGLSEPASVDRVLRPSEEVELGAATFRIPVGAPFDLTKCWMVAQLEDATLDAPMQPGTIGLAYVHGDRDMFWRAMLP